MKTKGSPGFEPEVNVATSELKDLPTIEDKSVKVGKGLTWDGSTVDSKMFENWASPYPVTIQLGDIILFKGTMEELEAKRDEKGVIKLDLPYNLPVAHTALDNSNLVTKPDSGEK